MQILHQANFNNNEDNIGQRETAEDIRYFSERFESFSNDVNINIGNITQIVN
jgi:hypothetical protein